jgi:hypothetical protein
LPIDHLLQFPHVCNHCEDQQNPVTFENGRTVLYRISDGLQLEIYLHYKCEEAWSRDFDLPLPPESKTAVQ